MREVIAIIIFCFVLFIYLHVCFHLKKVDDLEIYEICQPSKDKLEEVCDLRQPVVTEFTNDNLTNSCNFNNINSYERIRDRLYICKKENYPELTEDLVLTGAHSILVKDITNQQREKTKEILGNIYITDKYYRLIACIDDRAECWINPGNHKIWHFALESDDDGINYGVYANGGLLVETISIRSILKSNLKKL